VTIIDAHSRFLIRCEAVDNPGGKSSGSSTRLSRNSGYQQRFVPTMGRRLLPTSPDGLTKLSVWWLRLGIRLERIAPGKPQQNGRQERPHRTLKSEAAKPPRATLRAPATAFDSFRKEYNEERPSRSARAARARERFCTFTSALPTPAAALRQRDALKRGVSSRSRRLRA
jgi:transposase InsO family protein